MPVISSLCEAGPPCVPHRTPDYKIHNVLSTCNVKRDALAKTLVLWISNNALCLCVFFWATRHCQLYDNIECCTTMHFCQIYFTGNYITYVGFMLNAWRCIETKERSEIIWNANLAQQGNFVNVFSARHVSGIYAHHQEHQTLSCSKWFSAPSFWMGGGLESRCVGRVCVRMLPCDHHPSKNSV